MSIRDTACRRGCCWSPYGVCATSYRCRHHVEDAQTAQARADAMSLIRDLQLTLRPASATLSEEERTAIEGLRGVEAANVVASRYGVAESTVRSIWVKANKRLKAGGVPVASAPSEVVVLIDRIQAHTGWSHAELARRAGVSDRTLARVRTGTYATVSKKVLAALDRVAQRESAHV